MERGYFERHALHRAGPLFFSPALDSGAAGTAWQRILLYFSGAQGAELFVRAADEPLVPSPRGPVHLCALLWAPGVSAAQKLAYFNEKSCLHFKDACDAPLYSLRGRYLWFAVRLKKGALLEGYRVQFPATGFLNLLPGVYASAEDDFLRRFLGIFTSLYLDVEERIDTLPNLYDPSLTPDQFLPFLGELTGLVSHFGLFTPQQLRALLPEAHRLMQKKGTRATLLRLLEVYTGLPAAVVEYDDWHSHGLALWVQKVLESLFGDERRVTVLVQLSHAPTPADRDKLGYLVREYTPAFVQAKLIILAQETRLGGYTFLGRNTRLTPAGVLRLAPPKNTPPTADP